MALSSKVFNNNSLLILVLLVIVLASVGTLLLFNKESTSYKPGVSPDADKAVNQAQSLFKVKKAAGEDFSTGPCLTNDLLPNWVVDTVHTPRTAEDDLEKNQCKAYLEGRATHFVELDLKGDVVRVL